MSEFIGSRISLVSRSDIRYVGTLHEINSETATVALENVTSFGTEGRKSNPDEEIPPSDSVYEYIVFRGSDVKDLRIEEAPAAKENKPPQMPNDPAILGTGSRPSQPQPQPQSHQQRQIPTPPQTQAPASVPAPVSAPGARQNQQQQGSPGPPGPPQFPQYPHYAPQFYPPPQWGRAGPVPGPVPGPGYPGMPYGAPPGWYPPGPGFPQGGPFPYGGFPPGPPSQQFPQQQKPAPIGASANKQQSPGELSAEKPAETKVPVKPATQTPTTASTATSAVPSGRNPAVKEASPPAAPPTTSKGATAAVNKGTPSGPKNGRIMPAIPLQSPAATKANLEALSANENKAPTAESTSVANRAAIDDATKAATAAVAAAMAKLPPVAGQQSNGSGAVDSLTKKVRDMRTNEPIRAPRHPGAGGFSGHRGRGRGGHAHQATKIEVPVGDFDFESANAKFNKQDLVKEAIAGSPLGEAPVDGVEEANNTDVVVPKTASYNKASSFFDDLSSEIKDRVDGGERPGGRAWRGEEQKKNLETFGQGSVDNGYRGGYRGRGRGRGGMRGRGYGGNGQPGMRGNRGGHRGDRGESQTVAQ